ncbi:MAG TPA: hypothetical protein V6C65_03410 [Allocoleopsis sp.]
MYAPYVMYPPHVMYAPHGCITCITLYVCQPMRSTSLNHASIG